MCFEWDPKVTHISNVLSTKALRVDVHKDINKPGWAIAHVQVNKGAKDPAAKDMLRKGNTGPHKTTYKNVASIRYSQINYSNHAFQRALEEAIKSDGTTIIIPEGESSASGHGGAPINTPGQAVGEWVYDSDQRMQRYWDGYTWVYYDEAEKREKRWDGSEWQWSA